MRGRSFLMISLGIAVAGFGGLAAGKLSTPAVGQEQDAMMNPMAHMAGGMPTMPGQDAFGAMQENVQMLEADKSTDWSKVNIGALREHLIDMNRVTLDAEVSEQKIDNGLIISVRGTGRTLDAVRRMVPAHAQELDAMEEWSAIAEELPDGIKLTVTTTPDRLAMLYGLGFAGLLVQGNHHQPHHLMMAKGTFNH